MSSFNLTDASALFKIKYDKLSENVYNSANVTLARVKKNDSFVGKQVNIAVPQSFSGGVGSGSLPTSGSADYGEAQITSKKVYAVVDIDRETIKAAMKDEGAFVRATKEVVKKGVESYMRNLSRILFNDGTGGLAAGLDGGTNVAGDGTTSTPYLIYLNSATVKIANLEEKDLVNVNSETTNLEIVAIDPDFSATETKVSVTGTSARLCTLSASGPFATADDLYMQGSKDNDPEGLKGVLDATSGSKYNISVARRWKAFQHAAASASITPDLMNKVMLGVQKQSGKTPNLIVTSFLQYEKLLNVLEDQKRYAISPRDKSLEGKISFTGLEFMSATGPIGIFPERFVEDDRMYFLNDNHIEIHRRPDFGWFDDDGTVFLRKASSDEFQARYGGYLQIFINPAFHGVLTGLAV